MPTDPIIDTAPESLYFLPLGGSGEFGVNLNLYGHAGKWLMVDCGLGFADDMMPGLDIVLPDPAFIEERRKDLVALVITHAHEDHIGAIPHLWPRLRCPIYATRFAAALIRNKLNEAGLAREVELTIVETGDTLRLGPFEVELVRVTHSTAEPNLLAIRTAAGTVVHTGDWKIDPGPVIGEATDEARIREIGEQGVLAMVCDSTNAMVPGHSGSEAALQASLAALFATYRNRIAIACFSSNVARLTSIVKAAAACDRQVGLVGRSLLKMVDAARQSGLLTDVAFVSDQDIGYIPRDKMVLVCTGSQGEPRAALTRIADDDHHEVSLEAGDVVLYSSRAIPGNQRAIERVQGKLAKRGVEVVTDRDAFVHVSGHPAREELVQMYQWVRPEIAIPTHGEYQHMLDHRILADQAQVPQVLVPENGALIRLAPGPATVVDHVTAGLLGVDGSRVVPLGDAALRSRRRLSEEGVVVATLVLDGKGRVLADPVVAAPGLIAQDDRGARLAAVGVVADALEELDVGELRQDETVRDAARLALRRHVTRSFGKKPVIEVQVVRVR